MIFSIATPRPDLSKELSDVVGLFYAQARHSQQADAPLRIFHHEQIEGDRRLCRIRLEGALQAEAESLEGLQATELLEKRLCRRQAKNTLYAALKKATGLHPPWGSLTGIRPTRLVYARMAQGRTLQEACDDLVRRFDVMPRKARMLRQIVEVQQTLPPADEQTVDVYVGIPFCPSRCRYCSFISAEVGRGERLAAYCDALIAEIDATAQLIGQLGLRLRAFYMGGGTPTVLPPELLRQVLQAAGPMLGVCQERTVEAGRPDSLDEAKLQVLKEAGIGRLSINPQTMHDETLRTIGRAHTLQQTEDAYRMVRAMGFDYINMDLIAGLPGESPRMFRQTLAWARDIAPESLTIHSLCIKRSSDMHRWQDSLPAPLDVEQMVEEGTIAAQQMGLRPYYLYRQKHMAGNLENVGYAWPGMECLYNVDTMEDTVSVLAVGAGAISKRVTKGRELVMRAPNVKEISHYVSRVPEMIQRKRTLWGLETT
ncbi:MAG: coproporphyrinogen dehydrogenase HemZ [Clostridiales bacterium]|nr:coproporphyrinogen dehydrogenase HemZ [Clostridiales bacterium]